MGDALLEGREAAKAGGGVQAPCEARPWVRPGSHQTGAISAECGWRHQALNLSIAPMTTAPIHFWHQLCAGTSRRWAGFLMPRQRHDDAMF